MTRRPPHYFDAIVGFNLGDSGTDFASAMQLVHGIIAELKEHGALDVQPLVFRKGQSVAALGALRLDPKKCTLDRLQADLPTIWSKKGVAFFEANAGIKVADCYDPLRREQWALDTLGVNGPWNVPAPTGTTIVAIVDSGLRRPDGSVPADIGAVLPLDKCQPAFDLGGWQYAMYADGVDQNGHGTFLAGTIAAVPCNGIGVASPVPADWGVVLMPIKFFGQDAPPSVLGAAVAIMWAAQGGARVINASWHVAFGGPGNSSVQWAIQWATSVGSLVVAAAGNDGTDNAMYPTFPANFGHGAQAPGMTVLTAAATGPDDWKASFSNYSPDLVDIAAPGVRIVTTGAYWIGAPRYPSYSGTSAAAAFASSGAALVFALNPQWTPADVLQHLKDSADKLPSLALVCSDGNRLNLRRAVEGPLQVLAPADGARLRVGQASPLLWTNTYKSAKLDKVKIEFSPDDGATWPTVLKASTPNDGQWNWTPTARDSTRQGRIRITPTHGNFPAQSARFIVV
jgi:subtilisin family serine protease